jgi:cysteine synthase
MGLRFKKPEVKMQRLKAMFYGEMGTGKSMCACQFPFTAYIDTEDTTSKKKYADMINKNGGSVLATGDFEEILQQVKELMSTKHNFKTLVIDSLTIPYENLQADCERVTGSDFGRHVTAANKKMKLLINLLLKMDLNVIICCQAKKEYGSNMSVVGQTYNCYNRLGYMFDLVFETQIRGDKFVAITKKSRIDEFPMNETFSFSYDEVIKRYGAECIDKDVVPQELADKDQIKEVERLIDLFKVPEETWMKWVEKHNAESFDELPKDVIQKIIDHLKSKITQGEKA